MQSEVNDTLAASYSGDEDRRQQADRRAEKRCQCGHGEGWHYMNAYACYTRECRCLAFSPAPDRRQA